MNKKTAILIFANSSEHEVLHKFLPKQTVDVLNASTLKMVKATGLSYFHLSEKEQNGDNFAERFTNAISTVFNKGFSNVISIGNDTPHLTKSHILKSVEALAENDCVLGPSKDGGFYLMGLRKSHFNAQSFLKLPWQSAHLSRAVSRVLKLNDTKTFYLDKLQDIDVSEDAALIFNSFKTLNFQVEKVLSALISNLKHIEGFEILFSKFFDKNPNFNKGSPLVFTSN